jgi:hypothetical protein
LVWQVGRIADALEVMVPSLSSAWGYHEYWEPEPSLGKGLERSEDLVSGPRTDKGKGKDRDSGNEEDQEKEKNRAEDGDKTKVRQ